MGVPRPTKALAHSREAVSATIDCIVRGEYHLIHEVIISLVFGGGYLKSIVSCSFTPKCVSIIPRETESIDKLYQWRNCMPVLFFFALRTLFCFCLCFRNATLQIVGHNRTQYNAQCLVITVIVPVWLGCLLTDSSELFLLLVDLHRRTPSARPQFQPH